MAAGAGSAAWRPAFRCEQGTTPEPASGGRLSPPLHLRYPLPAMTRSGNLAIAGTIGRNAWHRSTPPSTYRVRPRWWRTSSASRDRAGSLVRSWCRGKGLRCRPMQDSLGRRGRPGILKEKPSGPFPGKSRSLTAHWLQAFSQAPSMPPKTTFVPVESLRTGSARASGSLAVRLQPQAPPSFTSQKLAGMHWLFGSRSVWPRSVREIDRDLEDAAAGRCRLEVRASHVSL